MKAVFYNKKTYQSIDIDIFKEYQMITLELWDGKGNVTRSDYSLSDLFQSSDFEFIYSNKDDLNWEDYLKLYHIVKDEKKYCDEKDKVLLLDKLSIKLDNLEKIKTR
jgi:hypothetical protein